MDQTPYSDGVLPFLLLESTYTGPNRNVTLTPMHVYALGKPHA